MLLTTTSRIALITFLVVKNATSYNNQKYKEFQEHIKSVPTKHNGD